MHGVTNYDMNYVHVWVLKYGRETKFIVPISILRTKVILIPCRMGHVFLFSRFYVCSQNALLFNLIIFSLIF